MTATYEINHCRFCGKSEIGRHGSSEKLVKYGVRHYAHHRCYLDAGKSIEELPAWKVGDFPFRLLKEHGLLDKAHQIIANDVTERVRRMHELGPTV